MNEYCYADIYVGQEETFSVVIDQDKMDKFREITGDCNPLHTNTDFAQHGTDQKKPFRGGGYKNKVVYGFLVASFYSTLAGVYLPGKWSLIYDVQIGMHAPTFIGDKLKIVGKVIEKEDAYNMLTLKLQIKNQDDKKVSSGKMRVIVRE